MGRGCVGAVGGGGGGGGGSGDGWGGAGAGEGGTSVLDEEEVDATEVVEVEALAGTLADAEEVAVVSAAKDPAREAAASPESGAACATGPAATAAALNLLSAFPKNPPAVAAAFPTASPTAAAAAAPLSLTSGGCGAADPEPV